MEIDAPKATTLFRSICKLIFKINDPYIEAERNIHIGPLNNGTVIVDDFVGWRRLFLTGVRLLRITGTVAALEIDAQ